MNFRQQVLFWFIASAILILLFGAISRNFTEAFFLVTFLLPVIVGTSYFFNYYLVPGYLLRKKYGKFVLYFFYSLIISLYLEMIVVTLSFVYLAHYQYKNMNPVATNIYVLLIVLYLIVFAKAFLLFFKKLQGYDIKIESLVSEQKKLEEGSVVVKSNRQSMKILFDELLYIESLGDYIKFILKESEPVISKEKISALEERLPATFIRIHRSFIVNKNQIKAFNAEEVKVNDKVLPISRTYKKDALEKLRQLD